jgi:DNA-binding CsgD family transcriptional regulator/tetratricopeptide (TPR) repeat protein
MGTSSEHTAPVGRAEQIRALDVLLGVVAREADEDAPRIRSLLIGGDAGIGKTTLVEVLAERCRAMGLSCAVGHCLDLATGMPFGPVVEALRDLHDRQTTEDSPVPRLSWLASEASSRSPSLESLVEATEILGRAGPAVLVIEDLHWADSSVRDFALAAQRTGRAPLLLVLTFRADDVTAGHPLRGPLVELSRSPRAVRMDLSGLAAHDVRELVRRRSGHAPDTERLAALMLHSDGNPLYVEELLSADEPGVPGLLHDLLLRHVGALSSSAVRISRLASVDGSRIDLEVLEEAAGLAPPAFAQAIHEMLERNVVVRHGNRYDFRHALLRESVHDDLLPGEIVEMHAAYARALRGRVESGSTEQRWRYGASLALHAMGAGDWPLALEASVWAGVAGKQYGSAAAADHFEHALYLWDRVPDAAERTGLSKADLPRLAARVLANEGVRDRVHDLLRLAVDLLDPDGDPLAACRVHTAVGANWSEVPGLPSRRESLDRAIALAGTTPTRELADALIASTFHGCRVGRYTEALDFATRALDVARAIGADDLVTEALWELAEPLWLVGRCSEALEVYREAVREAERSDELGAALEASGELAFYLSLYGSVDEAVQISRQVRERAERAGLPRYVAFGAEQELEILLQQGRISEAEALYETYCVPARVEFRLRWHRALLFVARGDMRGALAVEEEAFADGSNAPGVNHSPRLIEICEGLSDPERALDAAEALMLEVAPRDSPLEHALAADYAYRTLVLAGPSAARPAQPLAAAAAVSLDFARQRLTPEWGRTWDGMHLAIAEAFEAQLSGQSAIPQWHAAVDLAVAFGRYTSLRPRLELARAQLAHGERDEGKAMLSAVWHEAHEMGSRWLESQAAVAARRFRVPLPLDVDEPGPLDRLTPREREVLDHVARGATNRAIASALFITEKTASVHVGNVIAKLGVSNRGEAAALARSVRSDRDP